MAALAIANANPPPKYQKQSDSSTNGRTIKVVSKKSDILSSNFEAGEIVSVKETGEVFLVEGQSQLAQLMGVSSPQSRATAIPQLWALTPKTKLERTFVGGSPAIIFPQFNNSQDDNFRAGFAFSAPNQLADPPGFRMVYGIAVLADQPPVAIVNMQIEVRSLPAIEFLDKAPDLVVTVSTSVGGLKKHQRTRLEYLLPDVLAIPDQTNSFKISRALDSAVGDILFTGASFRHNVKRLVQ